VARGIQYLHSKNIVHGDIDEHSILIDDDGIPRLSGFSQSQSINHRSSDSQPLCGSMIHLAPEYFSGTTKETDVYAFSMVALEILTGKAPFFYLSDEIDVFSRVCMGERPERSKYLPVVSADSDSMWEVLVDSWDQDPNLRPNMRTVIQRLEDM